MHNKSTSKTDKIKSFDTPKEDLFIIIEQREKEIKEAISSIQMKKNKTNIKIKLKIQKS